MKHLFKVLLIAILAMTATLTSCRQKAVENDQPTTYVCHYPDGTGDAYITLNPDNTCSGYSHYLDSVHQEAVEIFATNGTWSDLDNGLIMVSLGTATRSLGTNIYAVDEDTLTLQPYNTLRFVKTDIKVTSRPDNDTIIITPLAEIEQYLQEENGWQHNDELFKYENPSN